ncbi:substrate-binding periplasmic protein [Marinobacter caseinilyticus]|uniref:substrate-binding periplasmic protein n=1 Tax=Marinobacter caseinilyticus TaxID=2692195 RepID=UPI00140B3771|nr:transporter substrate-binding domain-containing protein [Marinobacter caseinilyticus]
MNRLAVVFLCCWVPVLCFGQAVTVVTENFPPYNFQENGEPKGLSTEVVLAVLRELDMDIDIKFYPWARSYRLASSQKNHLIYSIARIPEREDEFEWIGAIAPYQTSLYRLKKRDDIVVNSLDDAKNYAIGCSKADVITRYLKDQGFSTLDVVSRDTQNLKRLARARVDLIAYDEASFNYQVRQQGLDRSQFERVWRIDDLSDQLYIAFSKDSDPEMVQKFRQALETIKTAGTVDRIHEKYFSDNR